jgi:transcription antitermination factor NusG
MDMATSEPKSVRAWDEVKREVRSQGGLGWYAVHCAGAPEREVEVCAKRIGWDVYIPKTRVTKPKPKRELTLHQRRSGITVMKSVESAMFPRYPFLYFDLADDRRYDMFKLFGVQGMLCVSDELKLQPARIPDAVIDALKAREINGVIPSEVTVKELIFSAGERVRIRSGAFLGFDAVVEKAPDVPIEKLDAKTRLTLLVLLFGKQNVVELPIADVERF